MQTNVLKRFAQEARIVLKTLVGSKMEVVLAEQSLARRDASKTVRELETRVHAVGKERVVEQVAYTWFNRFTALQYMDMNGFNRVRVIAPAEGQTRPQILADANAGNFNAYTQENTQNIVNGILSGRSPSHDPDNEAYRYLIVAVCNYWHSTMPFLFERIVDYTELLMPDDLLSNNSILAKVRETMTADVCRDIEVIGWLYQFYISEKKDEVFEGLKKNQKVTPENIPAATQLFTPHWIVKYLVENSLGRLWMLNNPTSSLCNHMEYYIAPEEPEEDYLKITSPEEIKICDPACGSGHMLTYAFDLLYKIYEEAGYDTSTVPTLILQNNLYGIELDKRAGELSAFALTMKARDKNTQFFNTPIQPNICVLENIKFEPQELNEYMNEVGRDLFTTPLRTTLTQFEESDNFGSLIQPALEDVEGIRSTLQEKDMSGSLFLKATHDRVLKVLHQADYLRQKYHVVIANPPYMGSKGMNGRLSVFASDHFPDSKSDLFAMFMERTLQMTIRHGVMAMINMQSWMFLSSYEKLRAKLLSNSTLLTMAHIGPRGFDSIGGEVVSTTAFVLKNSLNYMHLGAFLRLVEGANELEKEQCALTAISTKKECFYKATSQDFERIPGKPIVYWLRSSDIFSENPSLSEVADLKVGLQTGDNDKFLRFWFEVSCLTISIFNKDGDLYYPYSKGGEFRKWFGNRELAINWKEDGAEIKSFKGPDGKLKSRPQNRNFYFKEAVEWSDIGQAKIGARLRPGDSHFDVVAMSIFSKFKVDIMHHLAFLNSSVSKFFVDIIVPGIHCNTGYIGKIPFREANASVNRISKKCVMFGRSDWDSYETSWDFTTLPLLSSEYRSGTLQNTYNALRNHWQSMTDEMLKLEEENNRIFIDAYGLQDELTPDVPINEITLTCNPAYRYGQKVSQEVQEERLQQDTMKEFISYAVGCMFGRYALEEPGLILANAGETIEEYLRKVPNPSFPADDDNIIPILDGDWFDDDITERFRKFLRVTFGEEQFTENLRFIETSIGKPIRNYFLRDFYKDHVQTYKKRPIYWQFSSPKGSFNVLIYMHRYSGNTVPAILDKYLREFKIKLASEQKAYEQIEISTGSTQADKNKATNTVYKIGETLRELETWERDVIVPLASQRLEIDLDDGVKTNYPKFGTALTKITGVS